MLTPATLYKRTIRVINQLPYQWVLATLFGLFGFTTHLSAQSLPPGFASAQIQDGYNVPVGVIFSTDGRQLFIWDKPGRVWVSTWNGTTYVRQATPVIDLSEEVGNWGDFGLLSACLDPNFSSNGLLYLFYVVDRHHLLYYGTPQYSKNADEYANASISRVTRYRVTTTGGALLADQNSRRVLLGETKSTGIPLTHGSHAGGTLLFGHDGTLLVSTGDNASYDAVDVGSDGQTYYQAALNDGIMQAGENVGALRAQLLGSLCGKVLRLDPGTGDGVPSNPFFDGANARSPRSRVWAMGLRNPFRMTLQPSTGSTNPGEGNPGTLLLGDVGWYKTEDFHRIDQAGLNCGWPLYEGLTATDGYYGTNVRNEEEPGRPTFESLCQQPTSPAVDPDRTKRRFTHSRPALDWRHDSPLARVPAFEGSTPVVRTIGTSDAPPGTPFSGNASIGGAYYVGTQFPATYRNSYFFADWGQNWIKNLVLHDQGDHIVHEVRDFTPAGFGQGIADLEVNPLDGSLFYVNVSGQVMRISYGGNQPPVARPVADVTTGSSLLRVHFSGANSTDPEGRPLRFHWDFGDGTTSEETNPEHLFTSSDERKFIVTLVVTDDEQVTDSEQLTISLNGVAPTARITGPADGTLYPLDRASYYTLTAEVTGSDPQTLTYEWQVSLLHNTHEHPEPVISEVSPRVRISPVGCSGNESYSYRISLKVTNRSGLTATTSIRLYPDCQSSNNAVRQVTTESLPNAVRVNWQNPTVPFDEVLVAARAGAGFQGHLTGTDYAADADFTGNGTAFDGGKVVYKGRAETVTVRNLTASTPYFFRLYTRIGDTWNAGVEVTATPASGPAAANFAITGVTTVRCESVSAGQRQLTFTPQYAGLSGQPVSFWVANETMPTTNPGPYTLRIYTDNPIVTLSAQQSGTVVRFTYNWLAACAGGTIPPPPPAVNQPPTTANTIPNQGGVVGQTFNFVIPTTTFSDPNGDVLTYSVTGLPNGLSFAGNPATISGSPTTAGQTTVTLTATDPGNLSTSTQFQLTVSPASTTPPPTTPPPSAGFAITGVTTVRCESVSAGQRQLTFTPQYAGLSGQPVSFEVIRETMPTTAPGPYTLRIYIDNPAITLSAQQSGTVARFTYNWLAACGGAGGITPAPPASVNQAPATAQPVANQVATVGQPFSLAIPATTFSDPNGDALTVSVSGLPGGLNFSTNPATISGSPTTAGQTTVTLTATDPGNLSTSTQFQLTVSPASTTPPPTTPPPSAGFAITGVTTVRCESVSAGQRQLTFTPQYAGLSGQPVSFEVIRETMPTTAPGPYTLRIYVDNPIVTLRATQANSAAEASFLYRWLAACPAANARLGAESGENLTVRVLGNPVLTETAEVEILGGAGAWLRLQTLDGRGRRTSDTIVPQATAAERILVKLAGPAGLYLLHVSTPTQHRVVKLVKL